MYSVSAGSKPNPNSLNVREQTLSVRLLSAWLWKKVKHLQGKHTCSPLSPWPCVYTCVLECMCVCSRFSEQCVCVYVCVHCSGAKTQKQILTLTHSRLMIYLNGCILLTSDKHTHMCTCTYTKLDCLVYFFNYCNRKSLNTRDVFMNCMWGKEQAVLF